MNPKIENLEIEYLGNTITKYSKQDTQKKKWVFTINNYKNTTIEEIKIEFNKICEKYIFQEEIGEKGTPHLQGAIWLTGKGVRLTQLKKINSVAHWEPMKGTDSQNQDYCSKKESRKIGCLPIIWGFPIPVKIINELYAWQVSAEVIGTSEPDGRAIHWIYENEGNVGKSAWCKYMFIKNKCLVIQGGKLADIMNIIFNTDMDKCHCVIIDIPRNNGNKISYNSIECILNGMITNTKYETGIKVFNPPNVIVLSNYAPITDGLSKDRWNIYEIKNKALEKIKI